MSKAKLILHAVKPEQVLPDTTHVISALAQSGLIAGQITSNSFLAGQSFLELLVFLGCSPHINLNPGEGEQYCYIELYTSDNEIQCLGYTATVIPRCPCCKNKLSDWKHSDNWMSGKSVCTCPQCNTTTEMQHLNWRQEAAFGRFALYIHNIHPFEAVPSDHLLQLLHTATGFEWKYAYANV